MNKLLRFSMMALLCAVFGFAYAQDGLESPWSHTFSTSEKTFEGDETVTLSGADWTLAADWADPTQTDYNKDSSKGLKIGSNSKPVNGLTLSSSSFPGTITKVWFTFAARSKSIVNVAVTVGGANFEATTTQFTNQQNLTEVTFTGTGTGEIVISIEHDASSPQNGALYVGELGVEFTSSAKAAKPIISPKDGTVFTTESQEVSITTATSGATIHYTVNGGSEQTYSAPFTITETSTITAYASASGMEDSDVATATITKKVAPESNWYESFDNMNGVGGNDDTWKNINQTPAFEGADQEWTVQAPVYAGYKCASIRKNGSLTTNGLNLEGDGTLNFSAESWGTDTGNFYVAIVGGGTFVEGQAGVDLTSENTVAKVTLNKTGTWKEHSLQFTGLTTSSEFKFYLAADKRGFLDEVYVVTSGDTPPVVEVPVPTFSPAAGEVEEGTVVTISAESDDYEVYYTVDGTSPIGNNSALGGDATVSVTINEAVTIKAAAKDEEGNWSEVVEAAYTVKAAVVIEEPAEEELPEGTYFWETFSKVEGTGGNSGGFTGTIASSDIFGNSEDGEHLRTTDMIWQTMSKDSKCYGADACMKFGSSSVDGEFITREIALTDEGTLTFRAAGWGSGTNKLTIQLVNGFVFDEGETQSALKEITLTNASWTDYTLNIKKVTTTANGNLWIHFSGKRGFIDDIKVTDATAVTVNAPTITPEGGIFQEPTQVEITSDQSEASIYYTLDGSEPTNESTEYTGSFMLNETTTVKAIAYIGDVASTITTATFTFPLVVNSIAEFRQLEVGETAILNLEGAQVTVAAGNNVYVRDAGSDASQTANAICFYQCNLGTDVTTGAVISGQLTGTRADYNGLPELTNATDVNITVNGVQGDLSWVKNVENLEDVTTDNYVADLIMFEGTVTKNGNNFFIGDIQLYVNNQVAAANSVYGGEVQSGDKVADLVEDGKYYLVAGILTSYGSSKTPELLLMHVEETAEKVNVEYTFNSYGIGTFYYSDLRFGELPKNMSASIITGVNGKELVEQYLTANSGLCFIPSGCPVILRGEPNSTVTLVGKKETNDGETFEDNMLRGTDEEESCELADADYLYYQLSAKDGEVGFYWGAEEGAPFTNGAHKAFLALTPDQAAQAPAFYFSGTSTGISTVAVDSVLDLNAPMYNLAGQRVDKSYKGVVVQNGKKVIKK